MDRSQWLRSVRFKIVVSYLLMLAIIVACGLAAYGVAPDLGWG